MKILVIGLFLVAAATTTEGLMLKPRSVVETSLDKSHKQRRLQNTLPPTVGVEVDPGCVDVEGSGGQETFELTLMVEGAGGTSSSAVPIDIIFALDSSGSMGWNDPSGLRKDAAKSFVDKLDSSRDTAGVVSWDSNIDFTQSLSSDFPLVKSKIDQVDSSGGTNLNVGLNKAIDLLVANLNTESSAEVILFLTDGQGTYTYFNNNGPAKRAYDNGYVIYSIGLAAASSNPAPLQDMATNTGGQYYSAPTADNLEAIFNDIFEEVLLSTIPYNVDVTADIGSCITGISSISHGGLLSGSTVQWTDLDLVHGDAGMPDGESVELSLTAKSSCSGADTAVLLPSSLLTYTPHNDNTPASVSIDGADVDVNAKPDAECKSATKDVDENCEACFEISDIDNGSGDDYTCPADALPTLALSPLPACFTEVGTYQVTLTATDARSLADSCDAVVTVENSPPTARCKNAEHAVTANCAWTPTDEDASSFDAGSFDPEGPVSLSILEPGPFGPGEYTITLQVMDACDETDTCTAMLTVIDDEPLDSGSLDCGGPDVISPPDVTVEYMASYTGTKENGCPVTTSVLNNYACQFCNGADKTVDKLAGGSCEVEAGDSTFTIMDSGGVGDHISFTMRAQDSNPGHDMEAECTVCVTNPAKERRLRSPQRQLKPFECPDDWDMQVDSYECGDQV